MSSFWCSLYSAGGQIVITGRKEGGREGRRERDKVMRWCRVVTVQWRIMQQGRVMGWRWGLVCVLCQGVQCICECISGPDVTVLRGQPHGFPEEKYPWQRKQQVQNSWGLNMPRLLEENLDACEAGGKTARGGGWEGSEEPGEMAGDHSSKGLVGFYSGWDEQVQAVFDQSGNLT